MREVDVMIRMFRFAALAACSLTLASCVAMTRSECASADWKAIGFEDGATGALSTRFARLIEACGATGVNRAAYDAGRNEGLRSYCTAETGYAEGYARREYRGVCPLQFAGEFQRGYQRGLEQRRLDNAAPRIGIGVGVGSSGRVGGGVSVGVGF